ncbi:2'-5' RNA ligase family protein [Nonomuraea polychroma]|uniref:2'-5' RNA ligase family protein n=1 Tax=Nonomuraea polychroma TaxID=46176 RepID=UPI003D8C8A22
MSDFVEFCAKGRAALLSGRATHDLPMVEGARRWGAAVVLRPEGEVVDRLSELAATMDAPGHWVHGGPTLHVTLRSLEPYRDRIPEDDRLRRTYARAMAEAATGVAPPRIRLKGVSPHRGGVLVYGHPEDDTLVTLWKRFAHAMESRGVRDLEHARIRDRWYVSLVHFAGPLLNPREIVAWCDAHADADFGVTELTSVEVVQFVLTGQRIKVRSLERAVLGDESDGASPGPIPG